MKHLHFFKTDVLGINPPRKFTFPFYYEPHSLARIAAAELQSYLEIQTDFIHDFGLKTDGQENAIGKMFGVLVVRNQDNELGYLASFSGKLEDESCPDIFVPPVFDLRTKGGFYKKRRTED